MRSKCWISLLRQLCIVSVILMSLLMIYNAFKTNAVQFDAKQAASIRLPEIELPKIVVTGQDATGGKDQKSTNDVGKSTFKDQTCRIPKLDINGSEVASFFKQHKPLKCNQNEKNWIYIDDGRIMRLTPERAEAKCEISYFSLKSNVSPNVAERQILYPGTKMSDDFAMVFCTKGTDKWNGLLMSVAKKNDVIERCQSAERGISWSGLDVYFLGFDSVSQMTFRRKMPKTVEFLENTMQSVVLDGYNIVGDGTPQAFIPILTAGTEVELPLTRKRFKNASYVDDVYPFVWKNFSQAGYVTAYGEDAFAIGTFTYRLKGFREQPTDHYTPPFYKEAENTNDWNCRGSIPAHLEWFRYSREFMREYSSIPRFLLMHQSLMSHDDINLVGLEDQDVKNNIEQLYSEGALDNALVIVMADHGHRFAKLRETHQGQLEERLPFFSISLPKRFREGKGKVAFENLKRNKDRLTTPFDIHATLMELLKWPTDEELKTEQDVKHRSLSLFRPIPEMRSCDQADVEPHWCTCLNWEDAMKAEEDLKTSTLLAHALVKVINSQLLPVKQLCAPLVLNELLSSSKLLPNTELLHYKNVKDADGFVPDLTGNTTTAIVYYQVKIKTSPGKAIYEATILYDLKQDTIHVDLTALSHVNKYGDDPHCIVDQNYFLATFCVCYDRI